MSPSAAASGALCDPALIDTGRLLRPLKSPKEQGDKTLRLIFTANEIHCDEDHDFLCEALVSSWAN
jgi:hypothetical protein